MLNTILRAGSEYPSINVVKLSDLSPAPIMQTPSSHRNRHPHNFVRKRLANSPDSEDPAIRKGKVNRLVRQRSSVGWDSWVCEISVGRSRKTRPGLSS